MMRPVSVEGGNRPNNISNNNNYNNNNKINDFKTQFSGSNLNDSIIKQKSKNSYSDKNNVNYYFKIFYNNLI